MMTRPSRILIVDDEPNVTAALELILAAGKFDEITIAANADDAFGVLGLSNDDPEVPPAVDVILLDVMMPGVDGIEACARIRKTRRYRDIPILMCTGLGETTSLNQAFIAGAHDYLTKPIRKIELLARVRSAMRFKRELDRRRAREAELRSGQRTESAELTAFMDPATGLPNEFAFQVAMRRAVSSGHGYGLVALKIVDADLLRREAGSEAAEDLNAIVARAIASQHAPLDWKLYLLGGGAFLVLAPNGTAEQVARLGKRVTDAIAALRIVHGHSLTNDFVQLTFVAARGRDSELLKLPAELIRSIEGSVTPKALLVEDQLRAA